MSNQYLATNKTEAIIVTKENLVDLIYQFCQEGFDQCQRDYEEESSCEHTFKTDIYEAVMREIDQLKCSIVEPPPTIGKLILLKVKGRITGFKRLFK